MKKNKLIATLFLLSMSFFTKAQDKDSLLLSLLENKVFLANEIIGVKNDKYDSKVTSIVLSEPDKEYPYGNRTHFYKGKFTSGNAGPCGNECRTFVTGKYRVEENKVILFIETISHLLMCSDKPIEKIYKSIGVFTLKKEADGKIYLKAVK